jgi:IPT/TIG domain
VAVFHKDCCFLAVATTDVLGRLKTSGGETFLIDGTNFGPAFPRTFVNAVKLGNSLVPNCTMTIPHKQLRCLSVPGVGTGLRWSVSVLEQTATSVDVVSYLPPRVVSSEPAAVSTDGGLVSLRGTNFGADHTAISLMFNGVHVTSFTLVVWSARLRGCFSDAR